MPLRYLSCMVGYAETIEGGSEWPRDDGFEQPGLMEAHHGYGLRASLTEEQGHIVGLWQKTPDRNSRGITMGYRMGTKNRKGVPVVTLDELFELIERQV